MRKTSGEVSDRIEAIHRAQPDLSLSQVAEAAGVGTYQVQYVEARNNLQLPREHSHKRRGPLRDRIIAVHEAHPTWCVADIARYIGCYKAYVAFVAARHKLQLPEGRHDSGKIPTGGYDSTSEAIEALHRENPALSTPEIARILSCSDSLIRRLNKKKNLGIPPGQRGRPRSRR